MSHLQKQFLFKKGSFKNSGPSPAFLTPGISFVEDNFSMEMEEAGFGMIRVYYIYCALYFYYYYISSTSGHQAIEPRGEYRV